MTTVSALSASQLVTYYSSRPSELAAAMPTPAPEFVTVAVKRIVRQTNGGPYQLMDKGELVLAKASASARPTKFAPKWKAEPAAEVISSFFESIDSPAFKDCPDDIVWSKAVEWLNDCGGPTVNTLEFSRAINRALLARAGCGDIHPGLIP